MQLTREDKIRLPESLAPRDLLIERIRDCLDGDRIKRYWFRLMRTDSSWKEIRRRGSSEVLMRFATFEEFVASNLGLKSDPLSLLLAMGREEGRDIVPLLDPESLRASIRARWGSLMRDVAWLAKLAELRDADSLVDDARKAEKQFKRENVHLRDLERKETKRLSALGFE